MSYYSIVLYNREDGTHDGNNLLYKTFERACDAMDEFIRALYPDFPAPNRDVMADKLNHSYGCVHYFERDEHVFQITVLNVVD